MFLYSGEVPDSPEFLRVERLPRRNWEELPQEDWDLLDSVLKRPGGAQRLRKVQAAALLEVAECGGGFLPIGVGEGKTLISFLAPKLLGARRALLVVPAKLKHKTKKELEKAKAHWLVPSQYVVSYEFLSVEKNANFLLEYQPDLIFCDEAQKLKNPKAAVTRRVARYIGDKRPPLILASGTFTRKSVMDYWHLLRWTLGDSGSPLPAKWAEAKVWGYFLDSTTPEEDRPQPGPFSRLLPPGALPSIENFRAAYQQRLTQTKGVVSTHGGGYPGSLLIEGCILQLPPIMEGHYSRLRESWETPDGHPFSEAVDLWRHARELACGFYYRWNPRPPEEWLVARRLWCKFVREALKFSHKLDSELQVTNAVRQGHLPKGVPLLKNWAQVSQTFTPNQEAVWVDSTAVEYAMRWLDRTTGLCWVEHRAVGEALEKLTGLPYYGQGGRSKKGGNIEEEKGPCIVSIQANAEGRNLQRYNKNLILSCPPSGATLEQLLGRTHRQGQEEDTVEVVLPLSCREQLQGVEKALREAEYIEKTTGVPQKLLLADLDLPQEGVGWAW